MKKIDLFTGKIEQNKTNKNRDQDQQQYNVSTEMFGFASPYPCKKTEMQTYKEQQQQKY